MVDFPFHSIFLVYAFIMVIFRAYYTGLVDAEAEDVPKLEEGIAIRRIRYGMGVPVILGCLLYLINPQLMMWSHLSDLPVLFRWLGVCCIAGSAALYRWTHVHLSKNFTDTVYVRKWATLITTGPYRWVRHPMYVSGILATMGSGLTIANWFVGIFGTVLMLIIMIWRTPIEEKKLIERHGDDYHQYRKATGKFFPKFHLR